MIVADHMTPNPITVGPSTPVQEALRIMEESAVRHLPVLVDRRLVGVVSDRDLFAIPPPVLSVLETSVGEVMQREVVTVEPADSIVSALVEFLCNGIGCLPVVEGELLLGIITEFDLLELYRRCALEGVEEDPPVGRVVHSKALTVGPNVPYSELSELCKTNGFRHLPVVEGNELVGILSERDLRRAMGIGVQEHVPAKELMATRPQITSRDEPLSVAAGRMLEHRISALPVLGGDNLGILTSFDVLDHGLAAIREQAAS